MAENVGGPQPLSRQDRDEYLSIYKRGADQFERALHEYASAQEYHKKDAFRQVMDNALHIMNEAARALKRQDLLSDTQHIREDYLALRHTKDEGEAPTLMAKLEKELDHSKKIA